jgi:hypothetical protein
MKRYVLGVLTLAACGGAAPSPSAPTGSGSAAPESDATQPTTVGAARGELDRAEAQVSATQGDCAAACRALASMQRAAEHLCSVDNGAECARARERVDAARARVEASCGECER